MSEAREQCRLFHERLKRTLRCRLVAAMDAGKLVVEIWERPNGRLEVVLPKIAEDDLDAFLLNYRLFQQDNERISIRRVSEAIDALQLTKDTKAKFQRIRRDLNEYLDAAPEMQVLGEPVDRRSLINSLLYGVYAHLDEKKAVDSAYWERVLKKEHIDLLFVTTLEGVVGFLREFEILMRDVDVELKLA
jgi:hypothetical protein